MGLSSYEIAVNKAKAEKVKAEALKKNEQEKARQIADVEARLEKIRNEEKQNKKISGTKKVQSLVNCKACNNLISIRADICPKCRNPVLGICETCKETIPKNSNQCPSCGDPKPFQNHSSVSSQSCDNDKDTTQPRLTSNKKSATLTRQKERNISLGWFKIWIFILLPTLSLLNSIYLVSSFRDWQVRMPLSIFYLVISLGLYFRKYWAWQINWGIVAFGWISVPLYLNMFSYNSTISLLISFLIAICWIWPNALYWKKIKAIMI